MASLLENSTLVEQRSVIRFLLAEGEKPVNIYSRMTKVYGEHCLNRANFYKWVEQFKNGRDSVTDEHRPGRPVEVSTPSLENRIDDIIRADRRVTVEMIVEKVHVSVGTVHNIIKNKLKYRKTCARWVPKELTRLHKETRLRVCTELLERYESEGEHFLNKILTCDETWVHYYEPESKRQSTEWKHTSSPVRKKFKTQASAGKVMLTVFWDAEGPVFCDYLEEQRTINSQYYSDMLLNKVKPAMREKRRGSQRRGVILQQDNARPHTAQITRETIEKMGWEVLPHPPYSPDLAPSDFHLFGPLKEALRGKRFQDNEDVKKFVGNWLKRQDKEFFAAGIKKLVVRWNKCINVQGDYVEK